MRLGDDDVKKYAREMRRTMGEGEAAVWAQLKGGWTGYKFRRQLPIGRFIVDFGCHELRLAVEVDGAPYHEGDENMSYDRFRERGLTALGWSVVRVSDNAVRYRAGWFREFISAIVDHLVNDEPLPEGDDYRFVAAS